MISLLASEERSAFGIATILAIEKIPYRRVATLEQAKTDEVLIVAAHDLGEDESVRIASRPAIVMLGGMAFAHAAFDGATPRVAAGPCSISLADGPWPAHATDIAACAGCTSLRIPLAPYCESDVAAQSTTALASFTSPAARPPRSRTAIVKKGPCVWSLVDLGAAFTNLLTEDYVPEHLARPAATPHATGALERLAHGAYYAAPMAVRTLVQRIAYKRLESRLAEWRERCSSYPVDATGWLLIELLKHLILQATPDRRLVRIAHWPAPFGAAAVVTHDIEPNRYAYGPGLKRLLDRTDETKHPATFGLVAGPASRWLRDDVLARLKSHTIVCHGLEHRGESSEETAPGVERQLTAAKTMLENHLARPVEGFRSPRLDRSDALRSALDRTGFRYDSTWPDVDRENMRRYGGGVCLNLPYRPPVRNDRGDLRPSRCLELPLTAPDCIQPLFMGASERDLRAQVDTKSKFIVTTGGLYVALVHAGVFGHRDAGVREAHLDHVLARLRGENVWMTSTDTLVDWWEDREAVTIEHQGRTLGLYNRGNRKVSGLALVIEDEKGATLAATYSLAPGQRLEHVLPAARPATASARSLESRP